MRPRPRGRSSPRGRRRGGPRRRGTRSSRARPPEPFRARAVAIRGSRVRTTRRCPASSASSFASSSRSSRPRNETLNGISRSRRQIASSSPSTLGRWFVINQTCEPRLELEVLRVEESRRDLVPAGDRLDRRLVEAPALGRLGGDDETSAVQSGEIVPHALVARPREGVHARR